jgi:hypothetical protein
MCEWTAEAWTTGNVGRACLTHRNAFSGLLGICRLHNGDKVTFCFANLSNKHKVYAV